MATKPVMTTPAPVRRPAPNQPTTAKGKNTPEANEAEKPKREKVVKVKYRDVCDKTKLNAQGLITTVPAIPAEFNPFKMERIDSEEFASEDLFLDHQGNVFQARAEFLAKRGDRYHREAENTRKFGDPEMRKKVKKAQKLKDQLQGLLALLKAEGIETDEDMAMGDEEGDDDSA